MREPRGYVFLVTFLVALAFMAGAFALRAVQTGDRFDFALWEVQSLPNRWLYLLGEPLRDETSHEEALVRYFGASDRWSCDGQQMENAAEAAIESRIAAVLEEAGLGWPLSGAIPGALPPVDFELAASPHVLVISPRDRIVRERTESLRPDLGAAQIEAIEREAEADGMHSALVVPTSGVATYPAIVDAAGRYRSSVGTAAHEWVHHYLALFPLGRSYFDSNDTRAINETVADIAGDEIAQLTLQRFGDVPPPAPRAAMPDQRPSLDPIELLRDLRVEVDALLAAGRVEEAEGRMRAVQDQLSSASTFLQPRRINQAYFAWYGTYAARPESIDPLGDQVRTARERAGSLARFLVQMRDVRTRADVEGLARATR